MRDPRLHLTNVQKSRIFQARLSSAVHNHKRTYNNFATCIFLRYTRNIMHTTYATNELYRTLVVSAIFRRLS